MKPTLRRWMSAFTESLKCLGLGLRDVMAPAVLGRSILISLLVQLGWLMLLWHWHRELGKLFLMLLTVMTFGLLSINSQSGGGSVAGMGRIPVDIVRSIVPMGQAMLTALMVMFLLALLVYGVLVSASWRPLLRRYILPTSWSRVKRRYAGLPVLPMQPPIRVLHLLWLLPALLIPGLSALIWLAALCYLNLLLLYWGLQRLQPDLPAARQLNGLALGWLSFWLLLLGLVPLLNLLVPGWYGTALGHLVCRRGGHPVAMPAAA